MPVLVALAASRLHLRFDYRILHRRSGRLPVNIRRRDAVNATARLSFAVAVLRRNSGRRSDRQPLQLRRQRRVIGNAPPLPAVMHPRLAHTEAAHVNAIQPQQRQHGGKTARW